MVAVPEIAPAVVAASQYNANPLRRVFLSADWLMRSAFIQ